MILKWKSIYQRSKKTTYTIEKNSGFVDPGFVKTCDELVNSGGRRDAAAGGRGGAY